MGLFSATDLHTFGALVSISSNRAVYVELCQNKLQCVFMVMKEHVILCNCGSLMCFNSSWTTVELCGTEE